MAGYDNTIYITGQTTSNFEGLWGNMVDKPITTAHA